MLFNEFVRRINLLNYGLGFLQRRGILSSIIHFFQSLFLERFISIMNTKKVKLLFAALLSFNLIQTPIKANLLNLNAETTNAIPPTALAAICIYVGYNCLLREEHLVKNKFSHAQTWYDDMTIKYPGAHLNKKQFVQTLKPNSSLIPDFLGKITQSCYWFSSYDHIFFAEENLKEITFLYKKVIDGYPLDSNEQLVLAQNEFMLLHEAGHIEHKDSRNIIITIIGLLAVTEGPDFVYNKITKPVEDKIKAPENQNYLLGLIEVPGPLFTIKGLTVVGGLISVLRHQEAQADVFACKLADSKTLQGTLPLFENDEIDPMFELEHKRMTPFIKTDSKVGEIIQTVVGPFEFTALLIIQQLGLLVRSNSMTRWLYDFQKDMTHQGPSLRAQAIKDELKRRKD